MLEGGNCASTVEKIFFVCVPYLRSCQSSQVVILWSKFYPSVLEFVPAVWTAFSVSNPFYWDWSWLVFLFRPITVFLVCPDLAAFDPSLVAVVVFLVLSLFWRPLRLPLVSVWV